MSEFCLKYSKIIEKEEGEEEKKKKLLNVLQKIHTLKKKIEANDFKTASAKEEADKLNEECHVLKIESELQKRQIEILKCKVNQHSVALQANIKEFENIHEAIWDRLEEFISKARSGKTESEHSEVREVIEMREVLKKMKEMKKIDLKLEGEVLGLNLYKQFQEKQISIVQKMCNILEDNKTVHE